MGDENANNGANPPTMEQIMAAMREELRAVVGELGQQINTRLNRLEQPQRRVPIRNQNPIHEDEDGEQGDDESMPSLDDDDPLQNRNPRRQDPLRHNRAREANHREHNKDIKIVPPIFTGKSDPEAYMDWEKRLEYIFECYGYGEHKKVALAAAQLTENALAWWDRTVAERRRNRFGAVTTWADMKYLLRLRYVPDYYHRDLQKRFRKLSQDVRDEVTWLGSAQTNES
ncbi:uncharacterized protein LOC130497408 [Raphanus sativus]|uniref:Uncharacterized protein LOC130497408 n=1 Tax=Raphanus sativus TaxID=3726 RepID=A0A9W3C3H5_RAPSA|nr:uncharacterized protein LOC130497408 [Raphanus sativus]